MNSSGKHCKERKELRKRFEDLFGYFRLASKRLDFMHETPARDKDEMQEAYAAWLDAIILACCYLDALSVFRFGEMRGGENYIKFLQDYPDQVYRNYFRKISCLYLDQPPLDPLGKPQAQGINLAPIREKLYGKDPFDQDRDMILKEALKELTGKKIEVAERTLNDFSYAAYFYEHYRCYGVHHVQPPLPDISGRTKPYYTTSPLRLVFPRQFVLDTLRTAIDNFASEVLSKIDAGEGPNTANDFEWLKQVYGIKSKFIETALIYNKW